MSALCLYISRTPVLLTPQWSYVALSAAFPYDLTLPCSMEIEVQWQTKCRSNKNLKVMQSLSWGALRTTGSSANGRDLMSTLSSQCPQTFILMTFTLGYGHFLYSTALWFLAQTRCTHGECTSLYSVNNLLLLPFVIFSCCISVLQMWTNVLQILTSVTPPRSA